MCRNSELQGYARRSQELNIGSMRNRRKQKIGDNKTSGRAKRTLFALWVVKGIGLIAVPGWLFYRSVPWVLGLLCLLPLYIRFCHKEQEKEERERLNRGFSDALSAFSAALEAGYSAENALAESVRDMAMLYPEDEPIRREFVYLQRQLQNNRSLEQAFTDMAVRTQDEDVLCFAQVFEIAKRSGGDLVQVIKAAERNMAERADVKREIRTVLSAKKLEGNIMSLMPCGILLYFLLCDPVYLEPLYEGTTGRTIMTVLLAAYLGCVLWSEKITEIKV